MHDENDIKAAVRERYASAATQKAPCCTPDTASDSCCGGTTPGAAVTAFDAVAMGYSPADLSSIPDGADLGLGCGNPLAVLELREGETVLDLGAGAGKDCFIAAKYVGPTGRVIGVDMTPEMVAKARRNAAEFAGDNVEFRLGEIEHLPVGDASVDAIISNCVINLVPDKRQVFADAFRVLRPGGRLSVSDIVLLGDVPLRIRDSVEAYVACLSGAVLREDYLAMMADAGFRDLRVTEERGFALDDIASDDILEEFKAHTGATEVELRQAANVFQSIRVAATKPARGGR
jgi:SAM-dependent methyltransferase